MVSNPLRLFQISNTTNALAAPQALNQPLQGMRNSVASRTKTLRVLMVTPFYFPSMGGVENHVYQVARRLAHANVDITVLTTDRSGTLPANEQIAGVNIIRVPAAPANRDYYFAPGIARVIAQKQWDIVHMQCYHTLVAPIAMAAAWAARIPYVLTFHGGGNTSQLRNRLRGLQQHLLRPLLAHAERLIAVANFEIGFYGERLNLAAERFVLIPNGCDLPKLTEPATQSTAEKLIISIGRLEQYK
ncbi:MAG: glycosyltransferase family 4 protein, partial [Caldilineaceae bacterium]|nr:glycosyltransferase family 4 protein [Caldilineaceae bacterium]